MSSDMTDSEERLELAPEATFPKEEKKGFWKKLKRGLLMTHTEILDRVEAAFDGRAVIDDATLEFLEEGLIASDLGVETALELVESVKSNLRPGETQDMARLRELLVDDPGAELDSESLRKMMAMTVELGCQVIATSLETSEVLLAEEPRMFHVERGVLTPA